MRTLHTTENSAQPLRLIAHCLLAAVATVQDVNVPIAEATPGANKFAVDTASTLQCTFGPGLPNNRLVIRKTPIAIIVSHTASCTPQLNSTASQHCPHVCALLTNTRIEHVALGFGAPPNLTIFCPLQILQDSPRTTGPHLIYKPPIVFVCVRRSSTVRAMPPS